MGLNFTVFTPAENKKSVTKMWVHGSKKGAYNDFTIPFLFAE